MYPTDLLSRIGNDKFTRLYMAALFLRAKYWKQSKYLSIRDQLHKLQHICVMEHDGAMKNADTFNVHTLRDLQDILLTEVN